MVGNGRTAQSDCRIDKERLVIVTYKISDLARLFNFSFKGEDVSFSHIGLCNRNTLSEGTLSYVTNSDYFEDALSNESVVAVIVPYEIYHSVDNCPKTLILADFPEDIFYEIFNFLANCSKGYLDKPIIGNNCSIHPTAIIEDGVVIGDNVKVGAYTIIHSKTIIGENTSIGSHCAIGSNGFQALKKHNGESYNVPHIGGVQIGRNCYIAEFVNISKALFDTNVSIGNNVLIDVGCHIAHDCSVGNNSVLTAHTKMFGSSSIGCDVWMSPSSMVMNRTRIADGCHIAPGSFVISSTAKGETYIGNPAIKKSTFINKEIKLKKLLNK